MSKLEFNPIRTIKTINKDAELKQLYTVTFEPFKFNTLMITAKEEKLSDKEVSTLKDIYDSTILQSDTHTKEYQNLKEVRRKLPMRYGKNQIVNDIIAQGGAITKLQSTLLEFAQLETIKNRLTGKCISDHFRGTSKLSQEQLKKIKDATIKYNKLMVAIESEL